MIGQTKDGNLGISVVPKMEWPGLSWAESWNNEPTMEEDVVSMALLAQLEQEEIEHEDGVIVRPLVRKWEVALSPVSLEPAFEKAVVAEAIITESEQVIAVVEEVRKCSKERWLDLRWVEKIRTEAQDRCARENPDNPEAWITRWLQENYPDVLELEKVLQA